MTKTNGHAGAATMASDRTKIPEVDVVRSFDAEALNAVVNHPEVSPWVRGPVTGELDLTDLVADRRNYLLEGDFGSLFFTPAGPGLWEVHIQVTPEGRGAWTVGLARAAFLYMFTHTDACEILARIPHGNLASMATARRMGFSPMWAQSDGWWLNDKEVGVTIMGLTLQVWLASEHAAELDELADTFNETMGTENEAGETDPLRSDARRPLGFALAAIAASQPTKGCAFLNRWGAIAGFPPAFVASTDPLAIMLAGAIFRVEDGILVDAELPH